MPVKKRILVIGAGCSGLAAIKACKEENFEVVCYEKLDSFGGLWRYREDDTKGVSCVMKSTVTNISKEMSAFSDFAPPPEFPAYLHNTEVIKYFQLYAEHFDLLSCIIFYHEVTKLVPTSDYERSGRWVATIRDVNSDQSREEIFDGVMVCSGHHAYPTVPSFPGLDVFSKTVLHSQQYKTFNGMENKVVLVVGTGNSGADVAVDVSHCAKKVFLSTRRGTWIFPRMMEKGKPFDILIVRRINSVFPSFYFASKLEKLLDSRMDHGRFGLKPRHRAVSQTPTISDELPPKILTGLVTVKKNINKFTATGVVFDGETEETSVDVVIFATGYSIKFPFLSEEILTVNENKISLYKQMFPPEFEHPTMAIIGLLQPNSSLFPVYEMQARWFAQLLAGNDQLPDREKMMHDIRTAEKVRSKNYVQSPRHTVEVNWMDYMNDLSSRIGVKPKLFSFFFTDPKLFWACVKGPCLAYQFRLNGPHKWDGARDAIFSYKQRLYKYLESSPVNDSNPKRHK